MHASGTHGSASNAAAPQKGTASASAAQSDDTKNPSSKNYAPDTSTMSIPVQNALSAYERAKAQALAQQKETTQQKEAARQKESGQGASARMRLRTARLQFRRPRGLSGRHPRTPQRFPGLPLRFRKSRRKPHNRISRDQPTLHRGLRRSPSFPNPRSRRIV